MARQTTESLLAQAVRMNGAAHRKHKSHYALREFGKSAVALRTALYHDKPLGKADFIFMTSHMQVLEMDYLRWKRKHVWPADFH